MVNTISKATTEKLELWQPVMKNSEGKYIAILSDDSIDRDYEIVGAKALQSVMDNDGYTAILVNHENNVLGQIGEWTNKRLETIGGHTAFVAEPKFYMNNPNAQIIKGCMDEGAKYGISIGAIPKAWEEIEKNGETYRMYTELELLEASFVAIPSNRHGQAFAMAKSATKAAERFCNKNHEEVTKVEKDNKPVEEPVTEEPKEEVSKEPVIEEPTDKKFSQDEMDKSLEKSEEMNKTLEKMKSDHAEEVSKMSKEIKDMKEAAEALTKELEKLKDLSVMKGDLSTEEVGDGQEDLMKEMGVDSLPIVRKA